MLENITEIDRVIDKKMIAAMTAAKSTQFVQNMEALPREAANIANTVSEIDFIYRILTFHCFRTTIEEKHFMLSILTLFFRRIFVEKD